MIALTVKCAAKINLYLDILYRRDDGYHEIETLYQPIALWDRITLSPIEEGVVISGDDPAIPWDEDNLCVRSARALFDHTGFRGGVRIEVEKEIPPGAGLGGGSSDAAAILIGCNELFGLELSANELGDLGAGLGSDIPFFVMGRPALGKGRGEILEAVEGLSGGWILIVKPAISISTQWAYENVNLRLTRGRSGDTLKLLMQDLRGFPGKKLNTYNVFEEGVVEQYPEIGRVLRVLRGAGADVSSLSGSGSACFALFSEASRAEEARGQFVKEGLFTRIARPVSRAIVLTR
ncbi:MAG: 4-(cytidine 5'-diphospho)-2-C-methyl-D-erythritol kinase [bacterium]|nr:MAG: 4-(cytidine 5'-diphospho)-2-C-methyl-D-erythritol kinase [bacterium]